MQVVSMEACTALTRLDASDNLLTAADGIAACEALRWLSIAKNAVTSLEPLRDLAGLEVLNAARNQLEGRVSVGRLRALKALVLNDNQITAVSGLDKLELDTLVLSNNRVASLGGWLAGAAALQKLSLSHNPLPELGAALQRAVRAHLGLRELSALEEVYRQAMAVHSELGAAGAPAARLVQVDSLVDSQLED
jgi:Leucine-rich repeat (LRR) protein